MAGLVSATHVGKLEKFASGKGDIGPTWGPGTSPRMTEKGNDQKVTLKIADLTPISPLRRRLYILGVSLYLLAGGGLLILARRLPAWPVPAFLGAFLRPRWRLTLRRIELETGHCYTAQVPSWITSDLNGASGLVSGLVLFEDGVRLPLGHAPHDAIRSFGLGRYSHWGRRIYFAASDNSDPRSNGRRYRLVEARW
jgi:hypothetical protein